MDVGIPQGAVVAEASQTERVGQMKEQPAFIDFYNLHLASGYARNSELQENSVYPDEEEQQKLIDFFSKHESCLKHGKEITGCMNAKEAYQQSRGEFLSQVMDDIKGSLGEYELRKILKAVNPEDPVGFLESNDFLECAEEQRFSWFRNNDFLDFTREYHNAMWLVDSYIERSIPKSCLHWLSEGIGKYKRELSLEYLPMGMPVSLDHLDVFEKADSIDADNYYFTLERTFDRGKLQYGIRLYRIMFLIYRDLVAMLAEKMPIQHCAFEGGKRTPRCNNVLVASNSRKYCSKKCYDRARRSRRYIVESMS